MRRPRFTIKALLIVVLFAALAIGALRAASDAWDSAVLGAALLSLLTAVLLAVHRTGASRAFWLGFALFGWVYLGASMVPPLEARLPTTKGLAYLDSKRPGRSDADLAYDLAVYRNFVAVDLLKQSQVTPQVARIRSASSSPDAQTASATRRGVLWLSRLTNAGILSVSGGTSENFMRIGHSFLALVLGFLGGRMSRRLAAQ